MDKILKAFSQPDYPECKIIDQIKSGKISIDQSLDENNTLLHHAILYQKSEVAEFLIENGIEINRQNDSGETPLFQACEKGLIDEIWMLLFYGADPNILVPVIIDTHSNHLKRCKEPPPETPIVENLTCFDLVARSTNLKLQKLFLEDLVGYKRCFNLMTFAKSILGQGIPFKKLLDVADDVNHTGIDSKNYFFAIKNKLELFTMFLDKFPHVIEDVIETHDTIILDCDYRNSFPEFVKIMLVLFDTCVARALVDQIQSKDSLLVNYIIDTFSSRQDFLDIFTQLICCMLSYGVTLNPLTIHQIYFSVGYCDLLEILLHMELSEMFDFDKHCKNSEHHGPPNFNTFLNGRLKHLRSFMNPIMPRLIYDMQAETCSMVESLVEFLSRGHGPGITRDTICMVLAHFALPNTVKTKIFKLPYCKVAFEGDEYLTFMDVEKFPELPTLLELSRLRAREFIIKRYDVNNSMQFYTLLRGLSLASDYVEILSFERELYPLNKDQC